MTELRTAGRVGNTGRYKVCPEPGCGRRVSDWGPAWWNHQQSHNPAGHPRLGATRTRPDNCAECGIRVATVLQIAAGHITGDVAPYAGDGKCCTCKKREWKRAKQPPGTPRTLKYPMALLVEEVLRLEAVGITDPYVQAEKLGMKPLSFKRQRARARTAGLLPADNPRLRMAA